MSRRGYKDLIFARDLALPQESPRKKSDMTRNGNPKEKISLKHSPAGVLLKYKGTLKELPQGTFRILRFEISKIPGKVSDLLYEHGPQDIYRI